MIRVRDGLTETSWTQAPESARIQPTANGVRILIASLPECVDTHWAERDGRRWLVVRSSLTVRDARRHVARILTGQAECFFRTTLPDPQRPGATLVLTTAELPDCTEIFHGERGGTRFVLVSRSVTVARSQALVGQLLGSWRLRPQATVATTA